MSWNQMLKKSSQIIIESKYLSILTVMWLLISAKHSLADNNNPPTQQESQLAYDSQFNVIGHRIFDPKGHEFVIRGVNIFPDRIDDYEALSECWQFNTIRVNHLPDIAWYHPEWSFDQMEARFASQGIVTILDLTHDASDPDSGIGRYWLPRIDEIIDLYRYYAERYKSNPYVWFSLINEPDSMFYDTSAWTFVHQTLIQTIRETGNQNPILVSGWCWGQDACSWDDEDVNPDRSAILSMGHQVMSINGEAQTNIIFNHHVYDQFQYNPASKLSRFHDAIHEKGYAVVVGEYGAGNNGNPTNLATDYLFQSVASRSIGRIVWNWHGYDDSDLTTNTLEYGSGNGINDCSNPTNLTDLGKKVWEDNHQMCMFFN